VTSHWGGRVVHAFPISLPCPALPSPHLLPSSLIAGRYSTFIITRSFHRTAPIGQSSAVSDDHNHSFTTRRLRGNSRGKWRNDHNSLNQALFRGIPVIIWDSCTYLVEYARKWRNEHDCLNKVLFGRHVKFTEPKEPTEPHGTYGNTKDTAWISSKSIPIGSPIVFLDESIPLLGGFKSWSGNFWMMHFRGGSLGSVN